MDITYSLPNLPSRQNYNDLSLSLLNRIFSLRLEPYNRNDLCQKGANGNIDVLVQVRTALEININDYTELLNSISEIVSELRPKRYILFYYYDMDMPHVKQLSLQLPETKFEYYNLNWIERQLLKYPAIAEKFRLVPTSKKSRVELRTVESGVTESGVSESGMPQKEKVKGQNADEIIETLLKQGTQFFALGHMWGEEDKMGQFIAEGFWENGHEEKFENVVLRIKRGDIVFIQTSYSGYMRIKAIGVVSNNEGDGHRIYVV